MGEYADYMINRMIDYHCSVPYIRKRNKKYMVNKSSKVFASGYVQWAKIVGDRALTNNYEGTAREWTFDFYPDDTSFLKEHRLLDRLKTDKEGKYYIRIKKPEFNKEGEKNEPFRIYNADNEPWGDDLIGNGSKVDVKLDIRDWGAGKKKSIYAAAIRVTDLVSFQSNEFAGMDSAKGEDKAAPSAKKAAKPKTKDVFDELEDDEIPF